MAYAEKCRTPKPSLTAMVEDVRSKARMRDASAAYAALGRMTGLVLLFLETQGNTSGSGHARLVAGDCRSDMGRAYAGFTSKWTRAAIAANVEGFMQEVDAVFGILAKRVELHERSGLNFWRN